MENIIIIIEELCGVRKGLDEMEKHLRQEAANTRKSEKPRGGERNKKPLDLLERFVSHRRRRVRRLCKGIEREQEMT